MVHIFCQKMIKAQPYELCRMLLDHEHLSDYFNATFKVVKKADAGELRGGKGCVREVKILGVRFLEKIVKADEEEIHYCVLDDFPVKAHSGRICFQREGGSTLVSYTISCEAPWFIPNWLLQKILQRDVEQCLYKLGELGERFDPR